LAGACGVSSVSETTSGRTQLANAQAQPAAPAAANAAGNSTAVSAPAANSITPAVSREETVRKVAMSITAVSDPKSKSYKIGPLDVLEVTVFKVADLSKTVQVSDSGTINFPLVGEIQAEGKTAREVEQELTAALGAKYLQNPQITVFVKEYNSQRITVDGAVKKPGVFPMAGGMTLLQALAKAEGLGDSAESTAVVARTANGKRTIAKYDVSDIRSGHAEDPQLLAGDVVVIPTSDVKEGINIVIKFLPLAMLVPYL
jgi:polysaccharide export outer membrane protein